MKRVLVFVLLSLCGCAGGFFDTYGKLYKVVRYGSEAINPFLPIKVTFKNGEVQHLRTNGIFSRYIQVKSDTKKRKYHIKTNSIRSIEQTMPDSTTEYYSLVASKKDSILAKERIRGYLSFYEIRVKNVNSPSANGRSYGSSVNIEYLFFSVKGNEKLVPFPHNTALFNRNEANFKTYALEQFGDEPSLLAKIGTQGYERLDIEKIIKEYNTLKESKTNNN